MRFYLMVSEIRYCFEYRISLQNCIKIVILRLEAIYLFWAKKFSFFEISYRSVLNVESEYTIVSRKGEIQIDLASVYQENRAGGIYIFGVQSKLNQFHSNLFELDRRIYSQFFRVFSTNIG
jgi:hypothetical protein